MSDFEPTTDYPESIDDDDRIVASSAKQRDEAIQRRRRIAMLIGSTVVAVILVLLGNDPLRVLIAAVTAYLILRIGFAIIGAFARPVPEAPPQGELRRVKLTYRCSTCGSELRMTLANDEVPQAPRHCAGEMELTTALEDI